MEKYQPVSQETIDVLIAQGCTADDWTEVRAAEGFDPDRVRNVRFIAPVSLGALKGTITGPDGLAKECALENAVIADTIIGANCRIANVGVHIAHYNIQDDVCIEDVGIMTTSPGATFGNGVEVDALNEGGGRALPIFSELSSQFAYILCVHRHKPAMIEKMKALVAAYVNALRSDRGIVGEGACIRSVKEITDVCIGPGAVVQGANALRNGTILSKKVAPVLVGAGVVAEDFIIAESSHVTDGVSLSETFVGQGCRIGKKYSAEHSLFFANCEAYNGESCAIFAGPYTVTHHRSSLLIAGMFSFYNAGSGTNQSNHMYKLGPLHEGKLERGTKTSSFSYMMWPCRTGPFTVVMGKHSANFDTEDYPFSHIETDANGRAMMIPGLNLTTVGTVRDADKWPKRDRRAEGVKRDVLTFDVFSPWLVGKMVRAQKQLKALQKATDKSVSEVSVGGALVRRPILRTGQKFYRTGIEMYLYETIFERAERALADGGFDAVKAALQTDEGAVYSERWVDVGGQLMSQDRLQGLHEAIENGGIDSVQAFLDAVRQIGLSYDIDAWLWVKTTCRDLFDLDLDGLTPEMLADLADKYFKVKRKFLNLILADATKEFDDMSKMGFGQDGAAEDDRDLDFEQVRGRYEDNSFVRDMKARVADLEERVARLKEQLASL